jgi:hypothetical protein
VGHSTFLIESPQLVRIATDYNDYVKPAVLPDIATMNHAHSTHYSLSPDPGVKYVLHGWMDDEKPARIDLQYKDVRVRNVPTNIRTFDGGTERHGNSIFVISGICTTRSRSSSSMRSAASMSCWCRWMGLTRSISTAWSKCCRRSRHL